VLIATDEGVALLGDIFDNQLERIFDRRYQHARDSARLVEKQTAEAEAQHRLIREAAEALTREGQRLPLGPERAALLDIALKLSVGPDLSVNERLVVQKYERIAGAALKLTRSGAVPLSILQKQHAADSAALADKMKQRQSRLTEQAKVLEEIVGLTEQTEDFDGAIRALSHAIQRDRAFAEALVMRGALELVVNGEYGRAIVDCDNALRVDPGNAAALLIRSFGLSQRGSPGGAQADFQHAIRLEPHFSRYRVIFKLLE
jgi:tetratricopeptide (TPR) repeat protein